VPLHLQDGFKFLEKKEGSFPESEKATFEVLSLPIFPEISFECQEKVCAVIS